MLFLSTPIGLVPHAPAHAGRFSVPSRYSRAVGTWQPTPQSALRLSPIALLIVIVPLVKEARDRACSVGRSFEHFTANGVVWWDGTETQIDAVLWCTGFRPATEHLRPFGVVELDGRIEVINQRAVTAVAGGLRKLDGRRLRNPDWCRPYGARAGSPD